MRKKLFMLKKLRLDLQRIKMDNYTLAEDMTSQELKEYYFVFEEKRISSGADQELINKFDQNGIPINKTYIDVVDKDFVYFPISIGQVGLSVFHTFLDTKTEDDKLRFLKFAHWFVDNVQLNDTNGALWMTDVSLPAYKNPGPWQSAFSQSRGISILLRAYQITQNIEFAELAEKALKPFTHSIIDGGVTSFTPWGPFYEEYPAEHPTLVLNGMIFALCGILDFTRVFPKHELAIKLKVDGISTLINILPEYDLDYWSKYNLCKADWYPRMDPATILYQNLHITQLRMMYRVTGDSIFENYANIFESQLKPINAIRMYFAKYRALRKMGRL